MTFSRVKPAGWANGELLTSTQMNALDLDHSRALDGYAGGQATPSAQIDLQGTGGGAGSALHLQYFPTVTSQTVTRVQPMLPMLGQTGSGWELSTAWYFSNGYWIQSLTSATLFVPISNIPDKSSLTVVRVYAKGGTYSSLPAGMPTVAVQYINNTGTLTSPTPTATDGSASTGAFNAWHVTTCTLTTPLSLNQDTATAITPWVRVEGVSTGFEDDKYGVARIECDFTVTRLTPG